jgi:hypothetical protein
MSPAQMHKRFDGTDLACAPVVSSLARGHFPQSPPPLLRSQPFLLLPKLDN